MSKPFVYFGTPYVARDTLATLCEAGYAPSLVVSSPDAPKGRGMKLTPSDTKAWAEEHALPVVTPEKITPEAIAEIQKVRAEYAIVVAYGKILPEALIKSFPLGVLNIHYSLLPLYRGASPVEAALLHGEETTGVSIQKMVYELDAGDILAQRELSILPEETTRELRPRLIKLGAELLLDVLPSFEEGSASFSPQDHARATRSGKISKEDGELTLGVNDEENWRKYRAYAESPGTYFYSEQDGKRVRVKIRTATYENKTFTPLRVVPEGRQEMNYADFL